jgi:C1A family cysteine protease
MHLLKFEQHGRATLQKSGLLPGLIAGVVLSILIPNSSLSQDSDTAPTDYAKGLIPDTPEDLKDIPRTPAYRAFLPARVDLTRFFPPPGMQGKQGSCTAWAVGYAARAYYARAMEQRNLASYSNIPSPAYIYNSIKKPGACETAGSNIRDALDLLKNGSLSLAQLPYNAKSCEPTTREQRARATDFRIDSYNVIDKDTNTFDQFLDKIKGQLAEGNPVILSLNVSKAFERLKPGQILRIPGGCDEKDGCWHAITAVGYDEQKQAFKLINSWGKEWGDGGFGWVGYEILKEGRNAFVMRLGQPAPPQPPSPATCSLSVNPASIVRGSKAMLSFASTNAHGGTIDNGIGNVTSLGTKLISPSRTTQYTGTFSGPAGTATCTASVTVTEPQPNAAGPTIASFNASPQNITPGQSSKLSWSVTGATSISIDGGIGTVDGSSTDVSPSKTTVYTLIAANSAGTAVATTSVTVSPGSGIVLPEVECGKIAVVDRGGKASVVGFVGNDEDLDKIRTAAQGAEFDVKVRPWPQCEALMTLDKPLMRSDRPKVVIRKPSGDTLVAGDELVFEVETPPYPSYLHVAYVQADGSVVNLIQPGVGSFKAYPPRTRLVIGNESDSTRRFRVSEPFGREMLIVLAARSPIFPDGLPRQETEREFLTALRRALIAKPDPAAPDRDVVAGYDAIVTVGRATP